MKFKLIESDNLKEKYIGWAQEDIDLFEAIDWTNVAEGEDYDAGFAYLDSAITFNDGDSERVSTEFHKFFKNDPYSKPYYKAIEKNPFNNNQKYQLPTYRGTTHKDYDVYNLYTKE